MGRVTTWCLLLMGLIALVAGCGGGDVGEFTTLRPGLKVYQDPKEDGRVIDILDLGARVRLIKPPFWVPIYADESWYRMHHRTGEPYIRRQHMVPYPVVGRTAYVEANTAVIVDAPGPEAKLIDRRPLGSAITVAYNLRGVSHDYAAVIENGVVTAFVRTRDIGATPPATEDLFTTAVSALRRLDFEAALTRAGKARELNPEDIQAGRLLSALMMVERPESARQILARLPARRPRPDLPFQLPARPGADVYVPSTGVMARRGPSVSARVVGELPIGAMVHVLDLSGKWARVRVEGGLRAGAVVRLGALKKLARATEVSNVEDKSLGAGEVFVRQDRLDGAVPKIHLLQQRVIQWQEEGEWELATRQLESLLLLDPRVETARRLMESALKSGWYDVAVAAARRMKALQAEEDRPPLEVRVDVVYGCRGDLEKADVGLFESAMWQTATVSQNLLDDLKFELGHRTDHVCLSQVSMYPPCQCEYLGPMDDPEIPTPRDAAELKALKAAQADGRRAHQASQEEDIRRFKRWTRAVNSLFPPSPKVRIALRNPNPEPWQPPGPAFLFYSENHLEGDCGAIAPSRQNILIAAIPMAPLGPQEDVVYWADLPTYAHAGAGLVFASSRQVVEQWLARQPLPGHDTWISGTRGPLQSKEVGAFWESISPLDVCALACCAD